MNLGRKVNYSTKASSNKSKSISTVGYEPEEIISNEPHVCFNMVQLWVSWLAHSNQLCKWVVVPETMGPSPGLPWGYALKNFYAPSTLIICKSPPEVPVVPDE